LRITLGVRSCVGRARGTFVDDIGRLGVDAFEDAIVLPAHYDDSGIFDMVEPLPSSSGDEVFFAGRKAGSRRAIARWFDVEKRIRKSSSRAGATRGDRNV